MCTIICTVRTVLWYVMSIAGTLMILVALFTNKWLEGNISVSNLNSPGKTYFYLFSIYVVDKSKK